MHVVENDSTEMDNSVETSRKSSSELEKILGKTFPVLDHGFVRVVDYMGNDEAIAQAARVSYGKGTKSISKDEGLLRYLLRHRHTTPFEMCEIKLHIRTPIFVARQWLRHRTANVNEISARYSVLSEEYYIPEGEDICLQSTTNKQGKAEGFDDETSTKLQEILKNTSASSFAEYNKMIEKYNLTRELARIVLPMGAYTEFYWKIDLHNLMHFLKLRCAEGAQKEIREYANLILNEVVAKWVPITYKAFKDYQVDSEVMFASDLRKLSGLIDRKKAEEFLKKSEGEKLQGDDREFIAKIKKLLG